jgi:hypothetical protein
MITVSGRGAIAKIRMRLPSHFRCMKKSATRSALQIAKPSKIRIWTSFDHVYQPGVGRSLE